jgi:hypothetical protein
MPISFGIYSNVSTVPPDVTNLADITDAVTGPNHNNKFIATALVMSVLVLVFIGSATLPIWIMPMTLEAPASPQQTR